MNIVTEVPPKSHRLSLHFQVRSGTLCRYRGKNGHNSPLARALAAARHVIRQHGFTVEQAWSAHTSYWHWRSAPPGEFLAALAAWREAENAAYRVWNRIAPEGCPRPPELRLVLAARRKSPLTGRNESC